MLIWAFTQHHLILVACFLANRVWCTGREFPIFFQVFLFKDNNKEKEKLKFSMSEKAKGIWRNLTLCYDVSRSILKKHGRFFVVFLQYLKFTSLNQSPLWYRFLLTLSKDYQNYKFLVFMCLSFFFFRYVTQIEKYQIGTKVTKFYISKVWNFMLQLQQSDLG